MSQEKSVLTQKLTALQEEASEFAESLPHEQGEVAVSTFLNWLKPIAGWENLRSYGGW